MKHLGDITYIDWSNVEPVDVVTGGSPCQDLSVAGKRAGLEGDRSGLFYEQIRCVKELRAADEQRGRTGTLTRPRFMVWENIPGALSSNGGRDFQAVLTEICRIADPESPDVPMPDKGGWQHAGCLYDEMGRWSVAWRLHNAQFWGVPQRRKRIALVADFGGLSAPEILFERKGMSGDFEPSGEARQGSAGAAESSTGTADAFAIQGGGVTSQNSQGSGISRDVSFTLNSVDTHAVAGFMGGQGAKAGSIACGEEVSPALKSVPSGGNTVPDVITCGNQHDPQSERVYYGDGATHSLSANSGGGQSRDGYLVNENPMACDLRNGREQCINGTLQAKTNGGTSLNLNNIVRVRRE